MTRYGNALGGSRALHNNAKEMLMHTHCTTDTAPDTAHNAAPVTDIPCPRCGTIDTPTIDPGNGPHAFRALCKHCGAFLSWVSQYTPAERQQQRQQGRQEAMAQRPPSEKQLAYLQALGDDGPAPGNMSEASQRIDALRRARAEVAG